MNAFEVGLLDSIQNIFRSDILDKIFPIITVLGDAGIFWIILGIVLICFKKTRKMGIAVIISLVFSVVICSGILKPLVNRARPFVVNPDAPLIAKRPKDASFPSGHTSASFAAAFALMYQKAKYWIPAMVLAGLIAFSRLYLYFHFPTDVLAGIVLGLVCGFGSFVVTRKIYEKLDKKNNIV